MAVLVHSQHCCQEESHGSMHTAAAFLSKHFKALWHSFVNLGCLKQDLADSSAMAFLQQCSPSHFRRHGDGSL
jgi:hypothetical protein